MSGSSTSADNLSRARLPYIQPPSTVPELSVAPMAMPQRQAFPQFQSNMPSFQQLTQGGFNPASLQAMQRPAVQIPQNPFFGGAIPMDFSMPALPAFMTQPRYRTGSANEAFFAQQAAEEAARRAAAEAEAAEAERQRQNNPYYSPTPWTQPNWYDAAAPVHPVGSSLADYGPDGSMAYQAPAYDNNLGYGNN